MITPPRADRITVPERIASLLAVSQQLNGSVLLTLAKFEKWLEANKVVFFREYTDHGPDHVNQVLATASSLISDDSWTIVTSADAAVLVLSTLLHDAAMHLREDGFAWLVTHGQAPAPSFKDRDLGWPELWRRFLAEASRFDSRKLHDLFDDDAPARVPPLDRLKMTDRDRLLIGEFLRRHHARLAHEIAIHGVPGADSSRLTFGEADPVIADISGLVARSHNLPIREASDVLDKHDRRTKHGVHAPFIMAALRIADYIQVHAERAPRELLMVERLRSPVSRSEWLLHSTVESVHTDDDDPEAIVIVARPATVAEFAKATSLFRSIQQELDETWAVLGEIYGPREHLRKLGLNVRRVKSNLDDRTSFARSVDYIPVPATFTTAGADLLSLLVGPLYEHQPAIAVRELLQNAVDAVRERADANAACQSTSDTITVSLSNDAAGDSWLTISDAGTGMTVDTITNYFLCAGASFRRSEYWLSHHTDGRGHSRILRSGRFGIGVLAAFLAGSRIEVTTRHFTGGEGISLSASLDDKYIELRRTECEIGTIVRVRLTKEAARSMTGNPDSWDWYCLAAPVVTRSVDGEVLEQADHLPSAEADLTGYRRRIDAKGFRDVQWEYLGYGKPDVVCNGIAVTSIEHEWRDDKKSAQLDPLIERPHISVFDADGSLPLNLQRTRVHRWPFADELVDSIVCNIIAFVAIHGSVKSPLRMLSQRHPGMKTTDDHIADLDVSWLCCTPHGWTIAHPRLLAATTNRIVLVAADARHEADVFRAVDKRKSVVVVVTPTPFERGKSRLQCFLDAVGDDHGPRRLWNGREVTGYKFAVSGENENVDYDGDYFWSSRVRWPIRAEGAYVRSKGMEFKPTVKFSIIERELGRATDFVGVAEVELRSKASHSKRSIRSKVVRSWLRQIPSGYIPFSRVERKKLLLQSPIAEHAEMYYSIGDNAEEH
ncbi:MAG: molecular chaperone HtpG [Thermoanaerobaculia bacterium]|jgi:hypothetical protein|nr:molecular chaperone HtpG [Thermoanaerobaculia bacterium]